ncbi:MAG: pyrroline-5-carboxylate reductase [Bacteroidaceae bacterium]|nr:pyrroline-5-carboxylate reductase [Bacteroidaceae bacterium]
MKIAIIGAGNMGSAVGWGLLRSGKVEAHDLCISNPSTGKLQPFADAGVRITTDNCEAARGADLVMLFVKPWIVRQVVEELKSRLDYDRQMLLIGAAGISSHDLDEWLSVAWQELPACFLCIPNIAMAEGEGMTFLSAFRASDEQVGAVKSLFETAGQVMMVSESLLSAGTALASCGLAYAMRYVRAATEGGVQLGFRPEEAQRIVQQTVLGAVRLLQQSGGHPEAMIDKVTTAGGLTIRGLNEMEHAGFTNSVIRGLVAPYGAKN